MHLQKCARRVIAAIALLSLGSGGLIAGPRQASSRRPVLEIMTLDRLGIPQDTLLVVDLILGSTGVIGPVRAAVHALAGPDVELDRYMSATIAAEPAVPVRGGRPPRLQVDRLADRGWRASSGHQVLTPKGDLDIK